MPPSSSSSGAGRFFLRFGLLFGLGFLGLVAGTFVGGRYLVPQGQGLAGPAEALGYGAVAAVIAMIVAWVVSGRLSAAALKYATWTILLLGLLLLGVLAFMIVQDK